MSKAIVEAVAAKFEMTKKLAGEIVGEVISGLAGEIAANESTRITGLGTFKVKEKAARTGRNPATGEPVEIAAKKVVSFKAATVLKEAL